ncbi:MAG TPA: hypothetical protein ENI87_06510, partial [bacterium]|nr:hypothetical protein [bacterium]
MPPRPERSRCRGSRCSWRRRVRRSACSPARTFRSPSCAGSWRVRRWRRRWCAPPEGSRASAAGWSRAVVALRDRYPGGRMVNDDAGEREADLERRLRGGEDAAIGPLFESFRDRLRRMVQFRIDPRLVGRIDPEDVLQETFLEAEKRLSAYRGDDKPFVVWIRL